MRVHVARVATALRFHEHQDKVGLHFALSLELLAVQETFARYAVQRESVAFLGVGELPVGIAFDFLPQVLVCGAVSFEVGICKANGFLCNEQVVINQRYDRTELCHAGVTSPDKVNEQVRGDVEYEHRNDGFLYIETVVRAVPFAKQLVNTVSQREHEREHHKLQVRNRKVIRYIVIKDDNRRSILVSVYKSKSQVPAQESLRFVVQKRQEQNRGVENGIENGGGFHDNGFGGFLAGGDSVKDAA